MGLRNEVSLLILIAFYLTLAPFGFVSPMSPSLFLITQNLSPWIWASLSVCVSVCFQQKITNSSSLFGFLLSEYKVKFSL